MSSGRTVITGPLTGPDVSRWSPYPPRDGRAISLGVNAGCTSTRVVTAHVDEGPSTIRVLVRAKNDHIPPGQPALLCLPGVIVHQTRAQPDRFGVGGNRVIDV